MQQPWPNGPEPAYAPVAVNLARALATYAAVTPVGKLQNNSGITLISSGIRYAVFNSAVLCEPAVANTEQLATRLMGAAQFYSKLGLPWSCWVCRDHLRLPSRWVADVLFERQGLRYLSEHMGLVADKLDPPTRQLPELDIRPVGNPATRRDFAAIAGEAFDLPASVGKQVYEYSGLWRTSYQGYVAYWNGRPVTTAATCAGPEGIGLYSVGTAYAYRGRGFAERVTRDVIAKAQQHFGPLRCILQSTDAGLGLYQRIGFRPVTSVLVYATM